MKLVRKGSYGCSYICEEVATAIFLVRKGSSNMLSYELEL